MDWAVWFVLDLFVGSPYQLCCAGEEKKISPCSFYFLTVIGILQIRSCILHKSPAKTRRGTARDFLSHQNELWLSHKNLSHSARGVSWLLQPLLITRGQSEAVPGLCICVWLLYWEVVYFDLHIPAPAASHFHVNCCLYPVQFQWDNTVVKQSRIWHTMLTKLYFKLSLCAILMLCLHIMNMVVFSPMWLFNAQTYVNAVPQ